MLHVFSLSITLPCYLPALCLLPSLHHRLIEDSDSVPGMMLSNCCAETDLHNQTVRRKMGLLGKQLFLKLLACFWTICPHSLHSFVFSAVLSALMSYQCIDIDVWTTLPAFGDVMYTCFLRAELMFLFCYRCLCYRYKSIEHLTSSSSINVFTCSLMHWAFPRHRAHFYKPCKLYTLNPTDFQNYVQILCPNEDKRFSTLCGQCIKLLINEAANEIHAENIINVTPVAVWASLPENAASANATLNVRAQIKAEQKCWGYHAHTTKIDAERVRQQARQLGLWNSVMCLVEEQENTADRHRNYWKQRRWTVLP